MPVIDHSAVRIGPDFKGFKTALRKGLKEATAGVVGKVIVKIDVDPRGLAASIRTALRSIDGGQAKVKLVADARGFEASARKALAAEKLTAKVRLVAGGTSGGSRSRSLAEQAKRDARDAERAAEKEARKAEKERRRQYRLIRDPEDIVESHRLQATGATFKRVRTMSEQFLRDEEQAWRDHARRIKSDQDAAFASYATNIEDLATVHERALAMDQQFNRVRMSRARTAGEAIAGQELAARAEGLRRENHLLKQAAQEAERIERESSRRRKSLASELKVPKLINLGGEGIRPMNLLYASLIALSPVLIAVASSAVQAGTSIVALGSAAYGAGLAAVGLTAAFAGVLGALKLHSSLQKAQIGQSAKAAKTEISHANAIRNASNSVASAKEGVLDATRSLKDAQIAEKKAISDVAKAYQEAARKVKDLRLELSDLRTQQSGNAIDLAEAQRHQREIDTDFFATDLMKRQAGQDVAEAVQRGKQIAADLGKARAELGTRTRAGLGGSPEVVDARETARRATEARQNAQRGLAAATRGATEAQRDYTDALKSNTAAVSGALAQDAQLQAQLKDMSKAGRDLYYWLVDNTEQFKVYRRSIEQAILPGFLSFLKDVTARQKGAKSTTDTLVDGVIGVGRQISRTTANLGKLMRTKWFKGELVKLNKDNEKAFANVGDATVTLVRPITRLFTAASPLIVRFTDYLNRVADRFAAWIDDVGDARLGQWFKEAGDELADWWRIATNLGSFLVSIFKASLPTGNNLVGRLGELTGSLAAWARSDSGQGQLRKFFEYFRAIDYGRITRVAASVAALMGAWKLGTIIGKSPFFSFVALLATKWPDTSANVMQRVADQAIRVLSWMDDHPGQAATLLAVLAGLRALRTVKPLGDIFGKIPGVGKLFSIFGDRGASPANPLFVSDITGGGGGGKVGKVVGGLSAAALGGIAAAIAGSVIAGNQQIRNGLEGKPYWQPAIDLVNSLKTGDWAGVATNWTTVAATFSPAGPLFQGANAIANLFHKDPPKPRPKPPPGPGIKDLATDGRGFKPLRWDQAGPPPAWMRDIRTEESALTGLKNWATTPGPTRTKALEEYIRARKRSVLDYVAAVRSQQGPIAAEIALQTENKKSEDTLRDVTTQMGLSGEDAKKYADKIRAVPKVAKTDVTTPGMPGALKDFTSLKTKIDPVTGKKTITVEVNGQTGVFSTLKEALIYQRALQSGLTLDAADRAIRKDEETTSYYKKKYNLATGGHIRGRGTATSDSIPARLSDGEYVQPTKAVKHYGVDFMEAVRTRRLPKFATGGQVGKWPFPVDISKTMIPQGMADPGGGHLVGSADVARIAEATARSMGASEKQLIALIEAGIVESTMRNLNYGDRDSVGFLQQRASWGSTKNRMNVAWATRKFINKAKRVDSSRLDPGSLAQAVQVSAYPSRYGEQYANAIAILNAEAPFVRGGEGGVTGGGGGGTRAGLIAFGRWLQKRGYDVTENPAFGGVHGGHSKDSQHYRGNAIDVNHGAGTSAREQRFLRQIIPEGHRRGLRSRFMVAGHYNHAHFDLGPGHVLGGQVKATKYDGGGLLPPGATLAVNNTRKPETVRTHEQEKALHGGPMRIDRRDLALLASYIVNAVAGQHIRMDGRKVAETVRGYDYLPRGI